MNTDGSTRGNNSSPPQTITRHSITINKNVDYLGIIQKSLLQLCGDCWGGNFYRLGGHLTCEGTVSDSPVITVYLLLIWSEQP